LGVVIALIILFFALSGIVLNHRDWFSGVDVNRNLMPPEYRYNNWNNASVRGTEKVNPDSILVYGNIGIWLTDSSFSDFIDFNKGFPTGIDNRKVAKVFQTKKGELYAGTFFGLFHYNRESGLWNKIRLPIHEERICDITQQGDSLLVLSRSYLLTSTDGQLFKSFILPEPDDYDNKAGLFKTLWIIHSGEIYGLAGKLFVDLVGIIFIFLTITGLIFFVNRFIIRRRKKKGRDSSRVKASSHWNLKWHNKIGWTTVIFLTITVITGMFLRPPLLIAIATSKVDKIPHTILDSPNPWFDKLRRIHYDQKNDRFFVATLDGVYITNDHFKTRLQRLPKQPPISVMGVNAFEQLSDSVLLVGSFSGLFHWDFKNGTLTDYITKEPYKKPQRGGPPIGDHVVAGFTQDFERGDIWFSYGSGAQRIPSGGQFVSMPEELTDQPMSLWNLALEVHTARIFQSILGGFYILIVPLTGLICLFILVSGFVVWYKRHRKRNS
jgi:hypothetical protein